MSWRGMFADFFKPIARYNSERGIWYVYDGTVWQPDTENLKVAELAKLLADKLYVFALTITEEDARKRFIDRVRKLQLRKHRETMLKDAKSVFPLSMRSFDQDIYLFNCKNGTLDLRTMEFREHRPEDYLTKVSPVNYDPKADCPRWHTFMDEIMQGDKERSDYLQKAIGYSLTGDTRMECLFILYGPTSRNGKGTTMESILRIMGEYGTKFLQLLKHHPSKMFRADAKAQVSYDYDTGRITTFLFSVQHSPDVEVSDFRHIIESMMVLSACEYGLDGNFQKLVNPTGRFVLGGSYADCGVTGRKLACDTYGGIGRMGGGALSGKDPTKMDRSAAYMARKIAKDIVQAG